MATNFMSGRRSRRKRIRVGTEIYKNLAIRSFISLDRKYGEQQGNAFLRLWRFSGLKIVASPQKENGYTPIANELLEAIMRADSRSWEARAVLWVTRITYGWSRKETDISAREIAKYFGADYSNIKRIIRGLREMNVLTEKGIQKDYEKWIGRWKVIHNGVFFTPGVKTTPGVRHDPKEGVKFTPGTIRSKTRKAIDGAPSAIARKPVDNFKDLRLPLWISGYGRAYISSLTIEECRTLLKTPRLGEPYISSLKGRIAQKEMEMTKNQKGSR